MSEFLCKSCYKAYLIKQLADERLHCRECGKEFENPNVRRRLEAIDSNNPIQYVIIDIRCDDSIANIKQEVIKSIIKQMKEGLTDIPALTY